MNHTQTVRRPNMDQNPLACWVLWATVEFKNRRIKARVLQSKNVIKMGSDHKTRSVSAGGVNILEKTICERTTLFHNLCLGWEGKK
jgi:hypothetical protein